MSIYYEGPGVTLHHGDALEVARQLPDVSVQTIVTSPPYFGLRDYEEEGQYGAEETVEQYIATMVSLFRELRRVLADDGTLWLNIGDSFAVRWGSQRAKGRAGLADNERTRSKTPGLPEKNLIGVPWRVAFALQADGWILRSDIIWHKPSPMPEPVTDRPTKAHEYLFLFAKSPKYLYDADAIAETATGQGSGNGFGRPESISKNGPGQDQPWEGRPQLRRALALAQEHNLTEQHFAAIRAVGMNDAGKAKSVQSGDGKNNPEVQALADEAKAALGGYYREFLTGGTKNKRDVWTVNTVPFPEAHFAVYPPELIRPCILAGSRLGDTVLDPFSGSGTTGQVATFEGRNYVGIDLSRKFLDLSLRTRFAQPSLPWDVSA
jgi:DNA modification methylase